MRSTVGSTVRTLEVLTESLDTFFWRVPYGTCQKKFPDFLSTYRYFLSTSVGTSEGTSVGTCCTVRLKHITHAKKFFTRSEQLYIHNSPAVL